MKICTAICEYNPFHNGHLYHLKHIRESYNPDLIIIFMSGNFTQRGEMAILDKHTRAIHAIKAGADAVIEIPAVFSTQTAEIFAKGGVKLINSLNGNKLLCFGAESDDKSSFTNIAKILNNEPDNLKEEIKKNLADGDSLIRARGKGLKKIFDIDENIFSSPNNILGIEYTKAVQGYENIEIQPIKRVGSSYLEEKLLSSYPSSMAIRKEISNGNIENVKEYVPEYVYDTLPKSIPSFDKEIMFSLVKATSNEISNTLDCAEGLENAIKKKVETATSIDEIISSINSKRYTSARIKRILLSTTLGITKELIFDCLNSPLYLNVLAINGNSNVLNYLSNSSFPLITNGKDEKKLIGTALNCYLKDKEINSLYDKNVGINVINSSFKVV